MARHRRIIFFLVVVLSVAYVFLFVPPNMTGADDANMLATFQIDEWIQYPHVIQMTTPGQTLRETLTNILVYDHYFYGYPFYVTSALGILPNRATGGFAPLEATTAGTTANMLVLRQLSPLFMIVAVLLLVYCWTGFERATGTFLALAVLLTAPAVFDNNMWWHPESLTLLFVALTIFSLYRDNLRFGRWFVVAAIAAGLAAGTKQAGFWFFLTVAVYLFLGLRGDGVKKTIKRAAVFAGVMALTVVLSNPLLLVPSLAREIIATQRLQAERIAFGWDVAMARGPVEWYRHTLRLTYGYWWLYIPAVLACLLAAFTDSKRRLLAIITLTFIVPFAIYLSYFVAAKPARYFLPVMLPLLAALGYEALYCWDWRKPWRVVLSIALVGMILVQVGVFLKRDIGVYNKTLHRGATSPALYFHHQVVQNFLSQLPPETQLTIYRDPYVYVAPRANTDIVMDWNMPSLALIEELNPDLIMLHQHNIVRYADPEFVANNYNPEQARLNAEFYAAAAADTLPDYKQLLSTDFGLALVRR